MYEELLNQNSGKKRRVGGARLDASMAGALRRAKAGSTSTMRDALCSKSYDMMGGAPSSLGFCNFVRGGIDPATINVPEPRQITGRENTEVVRQLNEIAELPPIVGPTPEVVEKAPAEPSNNLFLYFMIFVLSVATIVRTATKKEEEYE